LAVCRATASGSRISEPTIASAVTLSPSRAFSLNPLEASGFPPLSVCIRFNLPPSGIL
jgi:hypothetical protein